MTCESRPDGGKLGRFKSVGTRASQFVALKDETSSFETKMDIEKVGRNRKWLSAASDTYVSVRKR